jgi:hypothetical protein
MSKRAYGWQEKSSTCRDRKLIDCLFQRVRACCEFVQGLLVCTDGFAAYPKSIVRAWASKKLRGRQGVEGAV